ncbi:NUDIX hydrolase [Marinisporobacter balticus]|uniref:NUDIX domain-containing protein n=1 Tax=Marinisporobacter balticus TaxID=2018667 RepID=A0A4R2KVG8_9FIRM|nr:NUDIX hydrolase [Marinisporobacter balticus]TCO70715.1 NUDIX domain-containing protein [Marinisporobacter balticus]
MRKEISSGGVVVFGNAILLLRKYNGDWVLPKGKVKEDETIRMAAIREVYEEGRIKAEIIKYIGEINYSFKNYWKDYEMVHKTVHWYLMKTKNMNCTPLKEEGFVEARFVHLNRASEITKYDDEREIIQKAIKEIKKEL